MAALTIPTTASAFVNSSGSWTPQIPGSVGDIRDITFVDAQHGWAVCDLSPSNSAGQIIATSDGGASWHRQWAWPEASPEYVDFSAITFSDAQHGVAWGRYSNDVLTQSYTLVTSDGGLTWTERLPRSNAYFLDVSFADATHGFAVGADENTGSGILYSTSDGGMTWSAQTYPDAYLEAVTCSDAAHAWGVGSPIMATTDGGQTWHPQSGGDGLVAVDFVDAKRGWAVGQSGAIRATVDGGASWAVRDIGDYYFLDVAFPDAMHGWIVGVDGVVLATTDGGVTWSFQTSGTDLNLRTVSFPDANHGWVGSDSYWDSYDEGHDKPGVILAIVNNFAPVPTITGITPASGAKGSTVTLAGTGLSGATEVSFNGTPATSFKTASATMIVATVPVGATSGPISVITPGGTATSSTAFTVTAAPRPSLVRLSPTAAKRGVTVTLAGRNFGGKRATSYVKFGALKVAKYVSWGASKIKCRVPAKAKFGRLQIKVTTAGGTSTGRAFTVKR